MNYVTIGKDNTYTMNIFYNKDEDFISTCEINDRYKIILIEEGIGFLKIGEYRCVLMTPMICCLNEKDDIELEKGSKIKACSLYFHPDVINNELNFDNIFTESSSTSTSSNQDKWCFHPFFMRSKNYSGIMHLDRQLFRETSKILDIISQELTLQNNEQWPCISRSYLIEIIYIIRRLFENHKAYDISTLNYSIDEIDQIVIYLQTNYKNKISIQDLTKLFHTNKTTLNEKFKKVTGTSVMAYLNDLRIRIACSMLRNTLLPISEVLLRVGFKDDAHFGRIFRKNVGCLPSEYRENNNWMLL